MLPCMRPPRFRTVASALAVLSAVAVTSPAQAAWQELVGGPSPINFGGVDRSAHDPSLASIAGVPYVAWTENDGMNLEVRVARLGADGTTWERVADSPSPINQSATANADTRLDIADVGGIPYVTWAERDGTNDEIRVARLNAAGTAWEKVGQTTNPASPLNLDPNQSARSPSLTSVNGVPYVAWSEADAAGYDIRVARLNAAGTGWGFVTGGSSPVNQSATGSAFDPDLTTVGGVPHVAWRESEGGDPAQIRVARLNAAGTAWEKVGQAENPVSPINNSPTERAIKPSLTAINGLPYVAWIEEEDTNDEVRVARPNAAGTGWERVGQANDPESPINTSPNEDADEPILRSIDGTPYVAWHENVGTSDEIRVARLSASGADWEHVADAPAPIERSVETFPTRPDLAIVGGTPYVSWVEYDTSGNAAQVRVSRLEPELISQAATPGHVTANLSATWRTYGLAYPLGFDYGTNLEQSTAPTPAPTGANEASVSQEVSGLTPVTGYQVRPFALAGLAAPRVLGGVGAFTTTPVPPDTTPPETTITKDPPNKLEKSKAKYKFTSNEPNSTFVCKFDKTKPKPCDAGKLKLKRLDDGKHKFKVYAVDAAGNQDKSPAKDKFKVL